MNKTFENLVHDKTKKLKQIIKDLRWKLLKIKKVQKNPTFFLYC